MFKSFILDLTFLTFVFCKNKSYVTTAFIFETFGRPVVPLSALLQQALQSSCELLEQHAQADN